MNAQAHTAETIAQLNEGGQYHTAAALALKTCRATLSIRRGSGKPSPFRAGKGSHCLTYGKGANALVSIRLGHIERAA